MKFNSPGALKHLAVFAMLLFLYPIIIFINGLFGYNALSGLIKSLVIIGIAYSGYFLGVMIKKRTKFILLMAYFIVTLPTITMILFLLMKGHITELVAAIFLALVAYIIGVRFSKISNAKVLSESHFTSISIVYLVGTFALWIYKIYVPILYIMLFYLFITVVYGLVHNRANIERNMKKRKYSLDYLPKKITSYNTVLLGISFVFILLGTLFISPLVSLFNGATYSLKIAVSDYVSKIVVNEHKGSALGMPDKAFKVAEEVADNSILNSILNILVIIFVLVLIYLCRGAFKSLLFTNRVKRTKIKQEETSEYSDTEKATIVGNRETQIADKFAYKQWKKAYRKYCKMGESADKYKFGYSLAIKGLDLGGVEIAQSDTTIEIMQKAQTKLKDDYYYNATYIYNDIRYGNDVFKLNDIADLDKALKLIAKL